MRRVLYTAAHSGFDLSAVPLGGGAAVCDHLVREWERTRPFEWEILGPSILGKDAPREKDLVLYSELDYAGFCRRFEDKLTDVIVREDPQRSVVLSNDVSEGPDFKTLTAKGFSIYTIYHVDVVDYFAAIYLRSWVKPETSAAIFRGLSRWGISRILRGAPRLIWEKQEASVRHSKGLIVPSRRMKEVLLESYPGVDAAKIHVLPWGAWEDDLSADAVIQEKAAWETRFPLQPGSWSLLMLSRLSPEKGHDRLLKALALWEKRTDFPPQGITLYVAGEPAYMMGKRYAETLRRLAAKLRRCRVHFVGYVSGARKKALLELGDLYVFPSRHESYGLTLLEALRAGLPVLAASSHGAREVFRPEFGHMIPPVPERQVPAQLIEGLMRLLSDRSRLHAMGEKARDWALRQKFSDTASRLTELLIHDA